MTIRYPDLQVVLPRSVELSNYQQQRSHHPLIEQQQITVKIDKNEALIRKKVRKLAKSEQSKICGQPQKSKNSNSNFDTAEQKNKRNNGEKQSASISDNTEKLGHTIDLRT